MEEWLFTRCDQYFKGQLSFPRLLIHDGTRPRFGESLNSRKAQAPIIQVILHGGEA